MHFVFLVVAVLFSFQATADTRVLTRIHNIDFGDTLSEEIHVYLASGQIARLSTNELELSEKLQDSMRQKSWLTVTLSDEREILDIEESTQAPLEMSKHLLTKSTQEEYIPSVISMNLAREFFYESMPSPKNSQCYNRAHVWTHEWRIKHNLYSNKVWVFFTRKYIRKFAFEWWFHVSPYVHVVEDGKVRERVMDVKYSRGPVKMKQWTDIFLRDDAHCPLVQSYSEQANFPEWGSCFTMKSSMYYYQPIDLEWKEAFGIQRNTWIPAEIVQAYLEAFDIDLQGKTL